MNILIFLAPASVMLALLGLGAFWWTMRSGQYDDPLGDASRILVEDETLRRARLALVAATARVLHNGLAVLGVSAPRKM